MIVDGTTIGLIGAGSLAAGLSTTLAVQKKFGIEVRNLNQKTLKQRSEEMQDRFKFGQPFRGLPSSVPCRVNRRSASEMQSNARALKSRR